MGEAADRLVRVVHALEDTGSLEVVYNGLLGLSGLSLEHELGGTRLIHNDIHALIDITVGVTGDGDRLLPELHGRVDRRDGYRGAEHGSVEHRADGSVRALVHLLEVVLSHPLRVGSDGRALDGHTIFLGGVGGVHGHLVGGLIPVGEAEVIVFGLQVHEGKDELILDHLPKDPGHLVAVHLDKRRGHFDFFHFICGFCNNS